MFSLQLVFGVPDYVTITHARDHAREPHYRTPTHKHTHINRHAHTSYININHTLSHVHTIYYIL